MRLILLVVLLVALARSQSTTVASCDVLSTEAGCKERTTDCKWCGNPGKGCVSTANVAASVDVCATVSLPPITNDCPNRLTAETCTSVSTTVNSVACIWCASNTVSSLGKCIASEPVSGQCPTSDNPCLVVTDATKCGAVTSPSSTSGEGLCHWCDTFGCLPKAVNSGACPTPKPTCTACDPLTKPQRKCTDGTEMTSECDTSTCTWKPNESGACAFPSTCPNGCGAIPALAVLCSDGVTTSTAVCNLDTCKVEWKGCPGCSADCSGVAVPDELASKASGGCADGTQSGPTCNPATCSWYYRACPITTNPNPTCPNGKTPTACLVSPCLNSKCEGDPLAIRCEADYCSGDGCKAVWYRENKVLATCSSSGTPPPMNCLADGACDPTKKPTTDKCANPKIFCGSTLSGGCEWRVLCPDVQPPTCDNEPTLNPKAPTCGGEAKPDNVLAQCPGGVDGSYVCATITLPFTNAAAGASSTSADATVAATTCQWTWRCPKVPTPVDNPCTVGGICGNLCVPTATKSADLLTPSVETCKAQLSTSCEAQCHQQFVSGACELKSDGACRFGYNTPQKFADCLAACAGTTQPVPVCKGDNLCSCDYTQCGFCMKPLTVQGNVNGVATTSTVNLHQCIDLSTPCVVDPSATFLTAKPATCFVDGAKTATDDSTDKPELEKKVESIDTTKVQEKVIANANTVQEAKDFIIAVKNQLSPVTNADNSVKVSVVVTVSGDRAPTDTEINAICSKVVIDAVQQVLDSTKQITLTLKNCNKIVSDSTKKRGVLQSNSQDVLVEGNAAGSTPSGTGTTNPTGTNPTGSSSAPSVFMSLAALLLATVALLL